MIGSHAKWMAHMPNEWPTTKWMARYQMNGLLPLNNNNNNNNNLVWWHCHRDAPYKLWYKLKSASHVSLTYQPHPFLQGAFHLTQPHPHAGKRKHGRSLTVMPWTTTDEFNIVPKTQRMSLASFPGQMNGPLPNEWLITKSMDYIWTYQWSLQTKTQSI